MNNEQTQLAIHELEEQFFKTFGINKQCMCPYFPEYKENGCEICIKYFQGKKDCNDKNQYNYPNITSAKLLEMICIILNAEGLLTINTEGNIEDIKEFVLRFLIGKVNKNNPYCHYKTKNKIKQQIQQLFKD